MKMDPWLQTVNLTKHYGKRVVVDNVNLNINKGEVFVFLGPSGAGKTTILNCIAGMIFPDKGRIYRDGTDITSLPANKRNIGMVFQDYSLFPNMTIRQNVEFPLQAKIRHGFMDMIKWAFESRNSSRFRGRVDEVLSLVQLLDHAGKKPEQLSGGEQQRVALARALVFDPELLCFDEPLGSLDKNLRYEMQFEIRSIQKRLGKTLLYVTHDQSEAFSISDSIAIVNAGDIEQVGTPKELYESPCNEFVALFLGECNTFAIRRVEETSGGFSVTTDRGTRLFTLTKAQADRHVVAIRPENLKICTKKPQSQPFLESMLVTQTFNGSQIRMVLEFENRERIVAVAPSGELDRIIMPGTKVYTKYSPGSCLILPKSDCLIRIGEDDGERHITP